MKHLMLALALVAGTTPALACADKTVVHEAAAELKAKEVIAVRVKSGRTFLVVVLPQGHGLALAPGKGGCFDTMTPLHPGQIMHLLAQLQGT